MKTGSVVEDRAANTAEVLKTTVVEGLTSKMKKLLGNADKARIGAGTVSAVGLAFFDKKKPQTVWASQLVPPATIAASLIERGVYDMDTAYKVDLAGSGDRVPLSKHWTKKAFGASPDLEIGDIVDVFVVKTRSESGVSFAYQTLKRV